jgi:hypothetical protein
MESLELTTNTNTNGIYWLDDMGHITLHTTQQIHSHSYRWGKQERGPNQIARFQILVWFCVVRSSDIKHQSFGSIEDGQVQLTR